jgi:L-iditol 2-dehydrogenase
MKAAVFLEPLNLNICEVDNPVLDTNGALIKIYHTAICGSDVRTYRNGRSQVKPPIILGHEMTGEVIEAPDTALIGKKVGILPNYSCGVCESCKRGNENLCESIKVLGLSVNGGMAEFMAIPAEAYRAGILFPLPSNANMSALALGEPLSCVLNAHTLIGTGLGDGVLVHGAGPIGIMHAFVAKKLGASWVAISDPSSVRRSYTSGIIDVPVLDVGQIQNYVSQKSKGWGVDVQIIATSAPNALISSLKYASKGGRISIFGGFTIETSQIRLDANLIHYRELRIIGATGGTRHQMKQALDLILTGDVPADRLISHHLLLNEVIKGIELVETGRAMRIVLDVGEK